MNDRKTIKELFLKLPQQIREVLTAEDLDTIVYKSIDYFNLTDLQKYRLIILITLVVLGLVKKDDMVTKIQSDLVVDQDKAFAITSILQEKILNNLETIHSQLFPDEDTPVIRNTKPNEIDRAKAQELRPLVKQQPLSELLKSLN